VTTRRALVALVTLVGAGWALNACARGPEASAAAVLSKWQAGTQYRLAPDPQPTTVAAGKVEVNEVFWYGCGHCFALDPALESWKTQKQPYVEFIRVPVIWGGVQRQHAKLFYTLEALHRSELHPVIFDAIHKGGNLLAGQTDDQGRALQLAFLKEQGISEQQFNEAYDSAEVAKDVDLAERITARYEVASVPTMIVQGSYSTSVTQAGGEQQLLALINDLAAREQRR
jgi:thiol:disulfide interchange protein DsbA